ncbi:MAG TPA: AraC family transcriptional regulator [Hyphomicrobiales bacterium]|nr:AraC family transcriptional regulator [Hyphomicrobiales bacterium]
MVASFRFSTDGLPLRERADALRRLRAHGALPMEPLAEAVLRARIARLALPGVGILAGTLAGLRFDGSLDAPGVEDDFFLCIAVAGRPTCAQRQTTTTARAGDAVLVSAGAGPFTLTVPTAARVVGLRVPRKAIVPLLAGRDAAAMRVISDAGAPMGLLAAYATAVATAPAPPSPELAGTVAGHLHDLIVLGLHPTRDAVAAAAERAVPAARLRAIKADIEARLDDESLAIAAIAARHGVTPRYVHKLFEREGVTYTQFVLGERLARAHRMLRNPRLAHCSVAAIAYDVGFGDISYFNRAFRRRYGATPSDVRAAGTARDLGHDGKAPAPL